MSPPPARRFVFADPTALHAAYRSLSNDPWVDGCAIDVAECSLRITLAPAVATRRGAVDAWFRRVEKELAGP